MDESAEITIQLTELRKICAGLRKDFDDLRLQLSAVKFWKIAWGAAMMMAVFGAGFFSTALGNHVHESYHSGIPEYVALKLTKPQEQINEMQVDMRGLQVGQLNMQEQLDRIEKKMDGLIGTY